MLFLPKAPCQHQILSVMRSGPDVSASCAKCWKPVFKEKEAVIWKYGLVGRKEKKAEASEVGASSHASVCEHKIIKVYRTDRYVAAKCMNCDTPIQTASELRLVRSAIVKPRIEISIPSNLRGKQRSDYEDGSDVGGEEESAEGSSPEITST